MISSNDRTLAFGSLDFCGTVVDAEGWSGAVVTPVDTLVKEVEGWEALKPNQINEDVIGR